LKLTLVPGDQYFRGLKETVVLPSHVRSQYQAPTTGLEVVTLSARSTALRCVTRPVNVSMIGIPTPYVSLLLSSTVTWVLLRGVRVLNELLAVTFWPPAFSAVATTV